MKFIKSHLMFILPMMAILLGIEFYLVFERSTESYEKKLRDGYSMLVIAYEPVTLLKFKKLNAHVRESIKIERNSIVKEISKGLNESSSEEILGSLPYFYSIHLDDYVDTGELKKIKDDLEKDDHIKKVETFGSNYSSSYRLFSFIQFSLKIFIAFMSTVSLFLIIKQMEIWRYEHNKRMYIMEIFGAPLMLRSGVLFKVAITDAILATVFTSVLFLYLKYAWASSSGIDVVVAQKESLFLISDVFILLLLSLCIVIAAVSSVIFSNKGERE